VLIDDVTPAGAAAAQPGYAFPEWQPVPPPPPRPRPWYRRKRSYVLLVVALLVGWLAVTAPLSKSLQPIAPPGIVLLSADGKPIARRGAVTDQPVKMRELPEHVPQAFLAVEDRRFFMHLGIDPWGIMRAAVRNTLAGGVREGGSTITQQLAKLSFLSSDQTAGRKLREAFIALWLEIWLSKNEILSRYLSNAYFGDNVYGLRAASQHYFSKEPEDLSVGEASMLAGLLKAPSRLAPTVNLKGARQRASVVKAAMIDAGYITERQGKMLKPAKLKVRKVTAMPTGTYFADWVLPQARELAGGGYGEQTVETTLDSRLQRHAIRAVNRAKLGKAQVALVAMRPTGEVVAMVGGKDYARSPFNRATQARRQPGSTFKLFVYLAAFRSGLDPESRIEDRPLTIGSWTPRNNGGTYRGRITLRDAFAVSSNVAAVRLAERVGRDRVIQAARDLGIGSPLGNDPSLALGTSGVTLLELTQAYASVANAAYPVRAHGLPKDEEGWFTKLWGNQRRFGGKRDEMLRDVLWHAANRGTGRAAALGIETFGKTGTTQDNRDAIFVGFAGDLVTAVWIGNDDNTPLAGIQGGGLPARIWRDFMSNALGARAALPKPVVKPVPEPADEGNNSAPSLSVPLGESGYELGVELGNETVTISAEPSAPGDDRPPIRREIPIGTIPQPPILGPENEDPRKR
jgi:penicillin-binding protein 1A